MNRSERVRLSKFLSYALRHDPTAVGLEMDGGGWVDLEQLFRAAEHEGYRLDADRLRALMSESEKDRFELGPDEDRVRATYGHTVDVDPGLEPADPPARLYHGTARSSLPSIRREGLRPRGRNYVHLSTSREEARRVGARHGRPVVLTIRTEKLDAPDRSFFRSADGVWLTGPVPPDFLVLDEESDSR